ncbi:DUF305 domain-containing protein [Gordonia spumicola]|uniref:DUF305 domain-containing protein n=1 Tax=Gordonia spumicola TaxID=589161 RepID=A0A7I9V3P1_9ACTN|nr:DUF305 domain-containing protein [Gordonia spumicola]GEE00045.1 DUF305 domain-containing protein [Gordonia spumicola]
MTARTVVTGAAATMLAALVFVLGIALRPALVSESPAAPSLSAVEIGYLQDMIAHHQQAVTMAQSIDRDGMSVPIRGLSRQMVQEQSGEIGTMIGFLQMADQQIQSSSSMAWMHGRGHDHSSNDDHGMPGSATSDEVASLGSLGGTAAENQFLRLMQRHHYGGIAMTQDLLAYGPSDGPVVRLARTILAVQTRETGLIGSMLVVRGVTD